MNELSPNPVNNTQEIAIGQLPFGAQELEKLPFNHTELICEIRNSADRVAEFGEGCQADLDAERARLNRIKEMSDKAIEHSLVLQSMQYDSFKELARASESYITLIDVQQDTLSAAAEKDDQLVKQQTKQAELNDDAKALHDKLQDDSITDYGDKRTEKSKVYLRANRDSLGIDLFHTGVRISTLQSEIETIRGAELPELEEKIAGKVELITRLRAEISAISEQIEHLVLPTHGQKVRDLFEVNSNTSDTQQITSAIEDSAITELKLVSTEILTSGQSVSRCRDVGSLAVHLDPNKRFGGHTSVRLVN